MKTTIQNRDQKHIVVVVDEVPDAKGMAIVMHGLSGTKDQPHIKAISDVFVTHGYTTVRFDSTNSFGESDGKPEDATLTNFLSDLEDVAAWVKTQSFYKEPFFLAGHSLGGISVGLFTEKNPELVKGIFFLAPVVSGKLSLEKFRREDLEKWEKTGWQEEESKNRPGLIKRLKWNHMVDRVKYDLLPEVSKISMPALIVVGERDEKTPPNHQQILFDALSGKKEMHIVTGAPHTFQEEPHVLALKNHLDSWLRQFE